MKSKVKEMMAIVLCFFMICNMTTSIFASDKSDDLETVYIEWYSGKDGDVPIKVTKGENTYYYEYNSSLYRVAKYANGEKISEYTYDMQGKLIQERKKGINISYEYERNALGTYIPIAFSFDGKRYSYKYENDIIRYIVNENGDDIIEYVYDGWGGIASVNVLKDTLDKGIEYVNSLANCGMIYDFETNLYYTYGVFYSPVINRILTVEDEQIDRPEIMTCALYQDMIRLYNLLMGSPAHGCTLTPWYSSPTENWYSSLDTVEILSRLIYGECTYDTENGYNSQRRAVMWVIMNRLERDGNRFPKNYRDIATQHVIKNGNREGEFSVITGTLDQMKNACQVNITKVAWSEATYMACALVCSNNSAELGTLISKPEGFTDQRFFLSYNSWNVYNSGENQAYNVAENIGNISSNNRNIFFNRYDE